MKVRLFALTLSLLIVLAMSSPAAALTLSSIKLQPVTAEGVPIETPPPQGVWATNDPAALLGAFKGDAAADLAAPLTPGISILTLFGTGTFPVNTFYGAVLSFTEENITPPATTAALPVYNANTSLAKPFMRPVGETATLFTAQDGTKVEVLSFSVVSLDCAVTGLDCTQVSVDKVSLDKIAQDGIADTIAQLVIQVTAPVATPTEITVDVDIKPGSDINPFNPKSRGKLPVAVLTTATFDAATIAADTVTLEGISATHFSLEDVDDDGDIDLMLHFSTQALSSALNIVLGDVIELTLHLTGETIAGDTIVGEDIVTIVPKGKGHGHGGGKGHEGKGNGPEGKGKGHKK